MRGERLQILQGRTPSVRDSAAQKLRGPTPVVRDSDAPRSGLLWGVVLAMLCGLASVAVAQPAPPDDVKPNPYGSGSAGSDATAGSAGSAAGSGAKPDPDDATPPSATDPSAGSAATTGSAGSGSGAGSSTGSGAAPTIIQLPSDVSAPEVNASANPTAVRLGGRFTLIVTAVFDAGVEVNLPEPFDLGPAFEVRKKLSEDRPRSDGKTTREWQIDVLAWELGDLRIPSVRVTYTVNGQAAQVETNAVRIRVDGVLGEAVDDPKALRDMQPPTELIVRDWFWLIVVGGGAWILAMIALFWYLERRRKRRYRVLAGGASRSTPPRRMDMNTERALAALLELERSGALARDDERRAGYARMVEIVREYIAARYRMSSLTSDLTSGELVRRLAHVAPEEELLLVEAWLEQCDLVKYGGLRTSAKQAAAVLDEARALVVTTSQPRSVAVSDEVVA